jgi:hypothetical protein
MIKWGGLSAVALATFIYSFFFGLVPAVHQYKQIKEKLCMQVQRAGGVVEDLGCQDVSRDAKKTSWIAPSVAFALIPNAAETALRDCFIATSCTPVQSWKFHGIGTGSTAAAEADTGCQTELTTQYNPDSTRATGSQTNNGANVYQTVGTNTVDATAAVTEFCLMSSATVGAGTIWTRLVFAAVNLNSADSLQTTYSLTIE